MEISEIVKLQRAFFESNQTKNIKFRLSALKKLKKNIMDMQSEICEALKIDLGKSTSESYMSEIGLVLAELNTTIKHLKQWSKPIKVKTPIAQFAAKSYINHEPFGVVLIISPWNYPFMLSIDPLIGAIAAGNCAIIKPSKDSPNVGNVIKKLVASTFDASYVNVVVGSSYANQVILNEKYDFIFFTGGKKVGTIVNVKAAETLTPVCLELGGKSPCIIDSTVNLKLAAKRVAFGKFLNCGQTCIAPDYVLVDKAVKSAFIEELKKAIAKMFGDNPLLNDSYGKIINQKQYDRLKALLKGDVVYGGKFNDEQLRIEPTLINCSGIKEDIMQEEIFGPLLPIVEYLNIDDAIKFVKQFDKPLALYLFTLDSKTKNKVLTNVSFGGGCINDCIMHIANSELGFGGVGASGIGKYHGKFSFDLFTNKRSIVDKHNWIDVPLRYQPYGKVKDRFVKWFLK